jgi:hypothetical protein
MPAVLIPPLIKLAVAPGSGYYLFLISTSVPNNIIDKTHKYIKKEMSI